MTAARVETGGKLEIAAEGDPGELRQAPEVQRPSADRAADQKAVERNTQAAFDGAVRRGQAQTPEHHLGCSFRLRGEGQRPIEAACAIGAVKSRFWLGEVGDFTEFTVRLPRSRRAVPGRIR